MADHARREFLTRSADGMDRCAREGRYVGGIGPFGYRVAGVKPHARLEPDETPLSGGSSAAAVVRWMYERVALDGWSCREVADELNVLGVPTHYARDGRGVRGERTQGRWRSSRVRNMLVSPIYRGEARYGTRMRQAGREVISSTIPRLVSDELWEAAQATLARNRICARNTARTYLLRSVMHCAVCGLTYAGSRGRGEAVW